MKTIYMSRVTGLQEQFRFEGSYDDGRGKHEVAVEVPRAVIEQLAEILRHTDNVGHAAWHVEHPTQALPCLSCQRRTR